MAGSKITLTNDSVLCSGCHRDAKRNSSPLPAPCPPRWYKKKMLHERNQNRHCTVCHSDAPLLESGVADTPCRKRTRRWAPDVFKTWSLGLPLSLWNNYFKLSRKSFFGNIKEDSTLCHTHYSEFYFKHRHGKCIICKSPDVSKLVGELGKLDHLKQCSMTDWVCDHCCVSPHPKITENMPQPPLSKPKGNSTFLVDIDHTMADNHCSPEPIHCIPSATQESGVNSKTAGLTIESELPTCNNTPTLERSIEPIINTPPPCVTLSHSDDILGTPPSADFIYDSKCISSDVHDVSADYDLHDIEKRHNCTADDSRPESQSNLELNNSESSASLLQPTDHSYCSVTPIGNGNDVSICDEVSISNESPSCMSTPIVNSKGASKLNSVSSSEESTIDCLFRLSWEFCETALSKDGFIKLRDISEFFMVKASCAFPEVSHSELDLMLENLEDFCKKQCKCSPYVESYVDQTVLPMLTFYHKEWFNIVSLRRHLTLIYENMVLAQGIHPKRLGEMIVDQAKTYAKIEGDVDFREVLKKSSEGNDDGYLFSKYHNKPLFDYFEKVIDTVSPSPTTTKEAINHSVKKKLALEMVVGILCNLVNRKSTLVQSLIGIVLFGAGVKERCCQHLHMFGITCTLRYVKDLASKWSDKRNVLEEFDKSAFLKISFDNLNFRRKFARVFSYGQKVPVIGRMLNLITGMLTHRKTSDMHNCETRQEHSNKPDVSDSRSSPTVTDFFSFSLEATGAWNTFKKSVFKQSTIRLAQQPKDCKRQLIQDIQSDMPDYTPSAKDNNVFCRVENAQASDIDDVCKYLCNLKKDLKIGESGYPEKVVVTGDQQTYNLMKILKTKYHDQFMWLIPYPGDWHLLKLAAENIRDIIWDGGFQYLAGLCNFNKDVTQWKDLHGLISSLHECIARKLVTNYRSKCSNEGDKTESFDVWCESLKSSENKNETSRFWAQMFDLLNAYMAYYFSIRSGNWNLRMASLPKLGEMFFAYAHIKYEELICQHINDMFMAPSELLSHFKKGEWTVSISGTPYRNVGIDENHEMGINKSLKEFTTHASEYRTINLASFMAYLDSTVKLLDSRIFSHIRPSTTASESKVKRSNDYTQAMWDTLKKVDIFSNKSVANLINICKPETVIPTENRADLLAISETGHVKMTMFIKKFILKDASMKNEKRSKKKLRTFSKRKATNRQKNSKVNSLVRLNKGLTLQIQKGGHFYDRVLPFPLALSDEEGKMRDRSKSTFKKNMEKEPCLKDMFSCNQSFTVDHDCEIIVDGLKHLHEPPPPIALTYKDFVEYLWKTMVGCYLKQGCGIVTIVIDKTKYLPPVREIIHSQRKAKTSPLLPEALTGISPDDSIPHGTQYSAAMNNPVYKSRLVSYVMSAFQSKAQKELGGSQELILDYENGILHISPNQSKSDMAPDRSNNKGEADNCVFFHAIKLFRSIQNYDMCW